MALTQKIKDLLSNKRFKIDEKIEPPSTIGIVDSVDGSYYFLSGQDRQSNLTLANKIVELLNKEWNAN